MGGYLSAGVHLAVAQHSDIDVRAQREGAKVRSRHEDAAGPRKRIEHEVASAHLRQEHALGLPHAPGCLALSASEIMQNSAMHEVHAWVFHGAGGRWNGSRVKPWLDCT